ncbi:MAG: HAD-IA family hydrolase [Hyphomicrobiales bacterium]|nr:HAD-IA family hydrolase [Hyphomicrobiales bacterium]
MTPTHPGAVVFDLDGTLVDSAADIARAMNSGFAPFGVAPFDATAVMGMIGGGAAVAIQRAAHAAGLELNPTELAGVSERFFAAYAEVSAEGNGLFPGAIEILTELRAQGVRTAVCTNKAERVARIAVRALGLMPHVDIVVGARDDVPKKPEPHMLRACIEPFGIAPAAAIMVGDSAADLGAGRAAGSRVILVDFGYSKTPASELGADALVSSLWDVPAVARRLIQARG